MVFFLSNSESYLLQFIYRYGAAEADCSQALSLDASYTKAYLRRGAARFQLGRVKEAEADYKDVLRLEPSNKQAQEELKNIAKVMCCW